jgi:dUTP pyrophosphatase
MKKAVLNFEDAGLVHIEDGPDMEVDLAYLDDKLSKMFEESGMNITVQYLDPTVKRLQIEKKGDWIDLYAAETVELKQGEHRLVHLGVAMKLPEGYEAHIVPRSSTFKKWGIIQANHVGIIDNSYSGPEDWWKMSVIAMRDTVINKGDKICQFRIVERQPKIAFVEGKMTDPSRGGFGSTGSK